MDCASVGFHPHARIALRNVRRVTQNDVACAIDELRQTKMFENADLVPDSICEGGIAIYSGSSAGTKDRRYKTVRFTGARGWPWISPSRDMVAEFRGSSGTAATFPDPNDGLVMRRNRRPGMDVLLCCKATKDTPKWTLSELRVVAQALINTGAFEAHSRRALGSLTW